MDTPKLAIRVKAADVVAAFTEQEKAVHLELDFDYECGRFAQTDLERLHMMPEHESEQ